MELRKILRVTIFPGTTRIQIVATAKIRIFQIGLIQGFFGLELFLGTLSSDFFLFPKQRRSSLMVDILRPKIINIYKFCNPFEENQIKL